MISTLLLTTLLTLSPPPWVPPTYSHPSTAITSPTPWWRDPRFGSLPELIEEAISHNAHLAAARAQLTTARAKSQQARAPLFPRLSADSTLNAAPTDSLGFQFGGTASPVTTTLPDAYYTGATTLRGNYALDFAGRAYLNYRAAHQAEAATREEVESDALNLSVQLTNAYFDVLLAREELKVQRELLKIHQEFLDVISLRFEKGEVSSVEVLQQRGQVANAASRIPLAMANATNAQRRLSLWLGRFSETTLPESLTGLPPEGPAPSPGVPADLIAHRPDLRSAAMRFKAARSRAKSALRHHLPIFNLSGQVGQQYFYSSDWTTQPFWGAGATLSIPLFSGLGDAAAVTEASAQARASRHTFDHLYRSAIVEVETTLTTFNAIGAQLKEAKVALHTSQLAYEQSRQRYLSGVGDYVSTVTTLRSYQQNRLTTLNIRRHRLAAEIQLRAAIGGPWTRGLGTNQRGKS